MANGDQPHADPLLAVPASQGRSVTAGGPGAPLSAQAQRARRASRLPH